MQENRLLTIYEESSIFQRSFSQLANLVETLAKQNP